MNSYLRYPFPSLLAFTIIATLLGGCTTSLRTPAPVEDRSERHSSVSVSAPSTANAAVSSPVTETVKLMPGSENAGKPGYYTVQRGDTLTRIGLDNGQGWRDLVRWNNLANPDLIEVGQVLRVVPPGGAVETAGVVVRPITPSANGTHVKPEVAPHAPASDENLAFIWPANGALIAGFDEAKNKGLDISGALGDPVIAAADGLVVYAGSALRGYGNLIILKHNNIFLTAYAHNQSLLVKEDQKVRKGQKIAEMGKSDSDRVKLHFEVRRQGKPVDPAKFLPAR